MTSQRVTLELSADLIQRAQQAAKARHQPLEQVLTDTLAAALPKVEEELHDPKLADFEREVASFERLKPQLLKQYPGRVVAIYHEQVVAVGDDDMDVYGEVLEKVGDVPCYIERVQVETPRRARITSVWRAR